MLLCPSGISSFDCCVNTEKNIEDGQYFVGQQYGSKDGNCG